MNNIQSNAARVYHDASKSHMHLTSLASFYVITSMFFLEFLVFPYVKWNYLILFFPLGESIFFSSGLGEIGMMLYHECLLLNYFFLIIESWKIF